MCLSLSLRLLFIGVVCVAIAGLALSAALSRDHTPLGKPAVAALPLPPPLESVTLEKPAATALPLPPPLESPEPLMTLEKEGVEAPSDLAPQTHPTDGPILNPVNPHLIDQKQGITRPSPPLPRDPQRLPVRVAPSASIDLVPFRPILPPNLDIRDLNRVIALRDTVCPRINQTLIGPNGEAVPSLRVVAAGMGRSGSTWQFNAIIHILREAGIEPATKHGQVSKHYFPLATTLGCKYAVIKCHQFHPYFLEIADYVITSHRDTRDSFASLVDLKAGFMFDHYWGEYRRWRPFACVDMKYEDFYQDQIREIDRLIQTLPVPKSINATRVWELVEGKRLSQLNAGKKTPDWDPKSGYFKGHVQDPVPGRWRKLIGTEHTNDLMLIENMTSAWLVAEGYDLWFPNRTHNASFPTSPPFPLSPHTALPHPISPFARCPLDGAAKSLGRDMPAPTDFNKQLAEWKRRRTPPTTPPVAHPDSTQLQHPTAQRRVVPDATPGSQAALGARRGQADRSHWRRP